MMGSESPNLQPPPTQLHHFQIKGKRAEGVLEELARQTFFTDWCFRNPKLPNGKELCDLLVIFDRDALIWQIKNLKVRTDERYDPSQVTKNLKQLRGARRSLLDLRLPIVLENPRRGPEQIDPGVVKEVFLVSVLAGSGEAFYSPSADVGSHVAHIFSGVALERTLGELDTLADFTTYLRAKERLHRSKVSTVALGGEENLLAYYLTHGRSFDFIGKANHVLIDEGIWEDLQTRPNYLAKKQEDRISYLWDSIIDRCHEGRGKTYELIARELARPNRFMRRVLGKGFWEAHLRAHDGGTDRLFRRCSPMEGVTYCFLFWDAEGRREERIAMLGNYCTIARGVYRQNSKVVGIATEQRIRETCSYDYCLVDQPEWTEEAQSWMERAQRETGILVNANLQYVEEQEYPDTPPLGVDPGESADPEP
jgi:hypothetical protein